MKKLLTAVLLLGLTGSAQAAIVLKIAVHPKHQVCTWSNGKKHCRWVQSR